MMKKALLGLFTALVCMSSAFAQGHIMKIDTVASCQEYTWPRNNQTYTQDAVDVYTIGDTTYILNFDKMESYVDTAVAVVLNGECSVEWDGRVWTTMGTFLDTLTAVSGCDSVVKMQVTLANLDTLKTVVECGSYTAPWGTVYTESRVIDTTISNEGCTYHNVINLTVNPEYTDTPVTEVTAGCSYSWEGLTLTDNAIHEKVYKTAVGQCDSIVRLRVTAYSGQQYDTTTAVACDSYTLPWGGNVTTSGIYEHDSIYGTYTSADNTTATCTHHMAINLTVVASVSDSTNMEPTPVTAGCSYNWAGQTITDTLPHFHLFTSVIGGCDSMAGIQVTYTNVNHDTTFAEYCGDVYNWKNSCPTLPLPGQANQYRFTTDTDTTVVVADTVTGCTTHYTLVLHFFTKVDTVEQYYCGESYNYTYKRFNTNTNTWQNATANYTASGYYTVAANGDSLINLASGTNCKTYRTLNLTLNVPEQRFRADSIDTVVCERFRFRADQKYGGWLTLTESCDRDITHSERSQSNTSRCYDSIVHVTLTVNKNTFIERNITECDSYTWTEFDGQTYTESGVYRDTLDEADANGCLMIGRLNLTINTTPVINIEGDWVLEPGESTVLKAVPTASSDAISNYKWYVAETLRSNSDSLVLENVTSNTDVRLVSTSVKNCVATNWITVTSNVGIDDVEAAQVNIYPNPASRYLNIESAAEIATVVVYNAVGQQVMVREGNGNSLTLDLGSLATGNYTLRISGTDGSQNTRKFIVNK